jgi:hypothetical protein
MFDCKYQKPLDIPNAWFDQKALITSLNPHYTKLKIFGRFRKVAKRDY